MKNLYKFYLIFFTFLLHDVFIFESFSLLLLLLLFVPTIFLVVLTGILRSPSCISITNIIKVINNTNISIHILQTTINYNWNKVEITGFNKELLVITLYNQHLMEEEINMLNNILWLLKRDHKVIATIKKALVFIEFYERRYAHPQRKNYRSLLSEYL